MDKRTFLTKLKERGYINSREDAVAAMKKYRDNGGVFDDEQQRQPQQRQLQQPQQQGPEPIWSERTGELVPERIVPYYKKGYENIKEKPYETMFPGAASVKGKGVIPAVKRNVMGFVDLLGMPDRAIDYLSGGAFTRGIKALGQYIEKIPGESGPARFSKDVLHAGKEIVTSPTTYFGTGAVRKALTTETPERIIKANVKSMEKSAKVLDTSIKKGIDKGIKPTVRGKSNFSKMQQFESNAEKAVRTIAENKDKIKLVDEYGEVVASPRNAAEFAQAIEQTKRNVYNEYHRMATAAGKKGAQFYVGSIVNKLGGVSKNLKYNRQIRDYAESLKNELVELNGASPEIIEARIKDLNSSLVSYYAGRVDKAKAQIDASIANLMREELDKNIADALGSGYQELKNKYGSLKAIEKEVNHRAIVNARRANKSLIDFTDIFTGSDLIGGLLTMNPMAIARGVAGRGIKEFYKSLNNPDKYIEKMFNEAYSQYTAPSKIMPWPKLEASPQIKKSLKTLKSQRGSIGGGYDIIGTPAIRDPKTGKIYTGNWRGHKDAIIKGEDEAIQSRLKLEHFKDNTNKPTSNVGFVDDKGNFISRAEAEKIMERKTTGSLTQQFHNIGIMTGSGGLAAGGLAAKKKLSKKNKTPKIRDLGR